MPASSTRCFAKRSLAVMPPGLAQALGPVLEQIAEMTAKIKLYDRQIQELGQARDTGPVEGPRHWTYHCSDFCADAW
jgi:hypothetical protein